MEVEMEVKVGEGCVCFVLLRLRLRFLLPACLSLRMHVLSYHSLSPILSERHATRTGPPLSHQCSHCPILSCPVPSYPATRQHTCMHVFMYVQTALRGFGKTTTPPHPSPLRMLGDIGFGCQKSGS